MADSSPLTTPKRKRPAPLSEQSPSPIRASFSFDINGPVSMPASGSSSPRTKVAHRFRGLMLEDHGPVPVPGPAAPKSGDGDRYGGGGVASVAAPYDNDSAKPSMYYSSLQMQVDENEAMMRKRTRISPNLDTAGSPSLSSAAAPEVPETPDVSKTQHPIKAGPTCQLAPIPSNEPALAQSGTAAQFTFDQAIFSSSPKPSPSKFCIPSLPTASDRPAEAVKSRVRKRACTPPLVEGSSKTNNEAHAINAQTAEVVDPVRAALTWHEDEITSYDPEDEDDDGVGLNGIGFKPTPAIAYARTMKRRQQLADYRKREEKEARARRNIRRRGSPETLATTLDRKETAARRVRFTEGEPSMMIETI